MNHPFLPSKVSPGKCATCSREILAHSKHATCESCNHVGPCEIFGNPSNPKALLLCEACTNLEVQANDTVINQTNQTIQSYGDFFNARITPIVELKQLYDIQGKSFAEFHESIKKQIEDFSRVLFEQQIQTTEDTISSLVVNFRAEVRTKLKEGDINYQPSTKAPKVSTSAVSRARQSPLEKMASILVANAEKQGKSLSMAEAIRKLKTEMNLT